MNYRNDRNGNPLSILGYGCMRFTRKGGGIDMPKAEREVMAGIEAGINYFDTAWMYPGNEVALGTILAKNNVRGRVNIATKLPQYLVSKTADFDKYFDEELRRLQTDHVDFYLLHMLADTSRWEKLKSLGIVEWIEAKKAEGSIRNLGFSFHGNSDVFSDLLNAYDWDFVQIQYNYLDEHSQGGVAGLKAAAAKGIPVIIMEPLRGGKLANKLPAEALSAFEAGGHDWTPATWAFNWLWNQPEVTCVLSGMNSMEMLQQNCTAAEEAQAGMMSAADLATIDAAKTAITAHTKVGCTECRYCMPCPVGVDIPGIFSAYNNMYIDSKRSARVSYIQNSSAREKPGYARQCMECGACESKCPQHLPIVSLLKEADRALSPAPYRLVQVVANRFMAR